MKDFFVVLLGGVSAAVIGMVAQIYVTYPLIEAPKIDLERKKVALEAQRQLAEFVPIVDNSCKAVAIDLWTWSIHCTSRNAGKNLLHISIQDIDVVPKTNRSSEVYKKGFTKTFPHDQSSYGLSPSTSGFLDFFVEFDKKIFPSGVTRRDLIARVNFQYTVNNSAVEQFVQAFPDMQKAVERHTQSGETYHVWLTPIDGE